MTDRAGAVEALRTLERYIASNNGADQQSAYVALDTLAGILAEEEQRHLDLSESLKNESPFKEWKFVHGCNDARSRRIARVHYLRAKRAGVQVEFVDCGVLYRDSGGVCGICSQPVDFAVFTVDHIVPIYRGGPHQRSNLQVAHFSCNSRKGIRSQFPTVK